jgi:hypothetical protein
MSTANTTAGMLDCASPESILDPSKRSFAGDQYSLGCVIYFMLTGRYPYPSGNMVDKMMAHQTMTPPPIQQFNPETPPELVAIVERLMQKSPEARYRDIAEVLHELNQLVQRQPVSVLSVFNLQAELEKSDEIEDTKALGDAKAPSLPEINTANTPPPGPAVTPPAMQAPLTPSEPAEWPAVDLSPPRIQELPPRRKSFLGRVFGKIAFWRPARDKISVSIMAPPQLLLSETVTIPVFAHADTADNIAAMGQTYFPNHIVVATTPLRHEFTRGTRLTFHLALPGITVEQPVQKFVWRGQTMPLPFAVHVPPDCRPGEIVGIVSISENGDVVANFDFQVRIGQR